MKSTRKIQQHSKRKSLKASRKTGREHVYDKSRAKASHSHSRKHKAPERLEELIRMVNQVPDGLQTIDQLHYKVILEHEFPEQIQKEAELLRDEIGKLPNELQEFVGNCPLPCRLPPDYTPADLDATVSAEMQRDKASRKYRYLLEGKQMLTHIAEGQWLENIGPFRMLASNWLSVDANGLIELQTPPLLECVQGVEAQRIRKCPVCEKIFWAERKDQQGCSVPCSHALRNRKYRRSYSEKYKLQRMLKQNTTATLGR